MAKKIAKKDSAPIYKLKGYSIDFILMHNPKKIEHDLKIKLLNVQDLQINFNVNANVAFAKKEKLIQCILFINVDTNFEPKTNLVQTQIAYDFIVDNFDTFVENNNISFPDDFLRHITNISISTSRGLMASKFSGTYLQGLLMPIMLHQLQDNK